MPVNIQFVKRLEEAKLPVYSTKEAAGADITSAVDTEVPAKGITLIDTGLDCCIPKGYEIQVRPRSGLALKSGITVLNSPGTVDSDYSGPLGVILYNTTDEAFKINIGDRIAQIVVAPVVQGNFSITDSKRSTERGDKGFGSTGV